MNDSEFLLMGAAGVLGYLYLTKKPDIPTSTQDNPVEIVANVISDIVKTTGVVVGATIEEVADLTKTPAPLDVWGQAAIMPAVLPFKLGWDIGWNLLGYG
jgi:hypothetical protein